MALKWGWGDDNSQTNCRSLCLFVSELIRVIKSCVILTPPRLDRGGSGCRLCIKERTKIRFLYLFE